VTSWVLKAGEWWHVAGLSSGELYAPYGMIAQEGEMPGACSTGWMVHGLWVGRCRVWRRVRAASLQSRVLLVGAWLCVILSISDRLGGGRGVAGVSNGTGTGSSVSSEGGVLVGWWIGWCGDGVVCWFIVIICGIFVRSDADGRNGWVWGWRTLVLVCSLFGGAFGGVGIFGGRLGAAMV